MAITPPAPLSDPSDVIFVVGLLEWDDGKPETLRGLVKDGAVASLVASVGLPRGERVAKLVADMNSHMGTPTGFPNVDDRIGGPQELQFSREELQRAESSGQPVEKALNFTGDGGRYSLTFGCVRSQVVFGAIRDKWIRMGSQDGALHLPVGVEGPTFDGIGRAQQFEGGTISWHPDLGAHVVWGAIRDKWFQSGREQFGYPITDEEKTPDQIGRFNHFRALQLPGRPDSSIYWHPQLGPHTVFGAIRNKWAQMGWEKSRLGYPVSDEHDHPGGRRQEFQHGALFWNGTTGAVVEQ